MFTLMRMEAIIDYIRFAFFDDATNKDLLDKFQQIRTLTVSQLNANLTDKHIEKINNLCTKASKAQFTKATVINELMKSIIIFNHGGMPSVYVYYELLEASVPADEDERQTMVYLFRGDLNNVHAQIRSTKANKYIVYNPIVFWKTFGIPQEYQKPVVVIKCSSFIIQLMLITPSMITEQNLKSCKAIKDGSKLMVPGSVNTYSAQKFYKGKPYPGCYNYPNTAEPNILFKDTGSVITDRQCLKETASTINQIYLLTHPPSTPTSDDTQRQERQIQERQRQERQRHKLLYQERLRLEKQRLEKQNFEARRLERLRQFLGQGEAAMAASRQDSQPSQARQLSAQARQQPSQARQLSAQTRQQPSQARQLSAQTRQQPSQARQLPAQARQQPSQLPAQLQQQKPERRHAPFREVSQKNPYSKFFMPPSRMIDV
jgi:hypothetical protein